MSTAVKSDKGATGQHASSQACMFFSIAENKPSDVDCNSALVSKGPQLCKANQSVLNQEIVQQECRLDDVFGRDPVASSVDGNLTCVLKPSLCSILNRSTCWIGTEDCGACAPGSDLHAYPFDMSLLPVDRTEALLSQADPLDCSAAIVHGSWVHAPLH